jgi:phosphate transport system permease protein
MSVVIPLGLGCAIYLYLNHHFNATSNSFFLMCSDVLASIPSIVYGLLGASLFCDILQLGYSILSGGLTLACMVLPLFIRLNHQILKSIPKAWIYASHTTGLSQWRFLFQIVFPKFSPQFSGIFILCLGRAMAETAALLFTSGYVLRTPESIFDSGRSLSVHIYELSMNLPGGDGPAAASALFLLLFLIASTSIAQLLAKKWTLA